MPVYLIKGPEDEKRLVNAKSKSKAIDFVVSGRYEAEAITTSEMVDLLKSGLQVEDANDFDDEPVQAVADKTEEDAQ